MVFAVFVFGPVVAGGASHPATESNTKSAIVKPNDLITDFIVYPSMQRFNLRGASGIPFKIA